MQKYAQNGYASDCINALIHEKVFILEKSLHDAWYGKG